MSEKNLEEGLYLIWAEAMQKLLTGWLELVARTEKPAEALIWNETVKTWQATVQETLAAQDKWLREWAERFPVTSGSPTDLRKNVQQAQVLLLRWTEVQQQLWQGWFNLIQQLGLLFDTSTPVDEYLLSNLHQRGKALVNEQEELVLRWSADRSMVGR